MLRSPVCRNPFVFHARDIEDVFSPAKTGMALLPLALIMTNPLAEAPLPTQPLGAAIEVVFNATL